MKVKMIFSQAFMCLLLTSSCTTLSFQSKGLIPITVGKVESHTYQVRSSHTKEFYLWGLVHPDPNVYVDEIFFNKGLISASSVKVQQYRKPWDLFKSIVSLGFYIPVRYDIQSFGVRSDD